MHSAVYSQELIMQNAAQQHTQIRPQTLQTLFSLSNWEGQKSGMGILGNLASHCLGPNSLKLFYIHYIHSFSILHRLEPFVILKMEAVYSS
jgi:hypothetical protein